MYRHSYADTLADAADDARDRERAALDRAAALLRRGAASAPGSVEEGEALAFTTELWAAFIRDLADPGNAMPDGLRADLMSIGLGVLAECRRTGSGESRDLLGIADVCGIIRDGLK